MVDFKKLLEASSKQAASLPSFPQKNAIYNIDLKNPDFSPHEDVVEQENAFGKMVKRKQTVYYVNTKEGILRISPNQIQQLNLVLSDVTIDAKTEYIAVRTEDSAHGLMFLYDKRQA